MDIPAYLVLLAVVVVTVRSKAVKWYHALLFVLAGLLLAPTGLGAMILDLFGNLTNAADNIGQNGI